MEQLWGCWGSCFSSFGMLAGSKPNPKHIPTPPWRRRTSRHRIAEAFLGLESFRHCWSDISHSCFTRGRGGDKSINTPSGRSAHTESVKHADTHIPMHTHTHKHNCLEGFFGNNSTNMFPYSSLKWFLSQESTSIMLNLFGHAAYGCRWGKKKTQGDKSAVCISPCTCPARNTILANLTRETMWHTTLISTQWQCMWASPPRNPAHFATETFGGYSRLRHHVIKFLSFSTLKHCLT